MAPKPKSNAQVEYEARRRGRENAAAKGRRGPLGQAEAGPRAEMVEKVRATKADAAREGRMVSTAQKARLRELHMEAVQDVLGREGLDPAESRTLAMRITNQANDTWDAAARKIELNDAITATPGEKLPTVKRVAKNIALGKPGLGADDALHGFDAGFVTHSRGARPLERALAQANPRVRSLNEAAAQFARSGGGELNWGTAKNPSASAAIRNAWNELLEAARPRIGGSTDPATIAEALNATAQQRNMMNWASLDAASLPGTVGTIPLQPPGISPAVPMQPPGISPAATARPVSPMSPLASGFADPAHFDAWSRDLDAQILARTGKPASAFPDFNRAAYYEASPQMVRGEWLDDLLVNENMAPMSRAAPLPPAMRALPAAPEPLALPRGPSGAPGLRSLPAAQGPLGSLPPGGAPPRALPSGMPEPLALGPGPTPAPRALPAGGPGGGLARTAGGFTDDIGAALTGGVDDGLFATGGKYALPALEETAAKGGLWGTLGKVGLTKPTGLKSMIGPGLAGLGANFAGQAIGDELTEAGDSDLSRNVGQFAQGFGSAAQYLAPLGALGPVGWGIAGVGSTLMGLGNAIWGSNRTERDDLADFIDDQGGDSGLRRAALSQYDTAVKQGTDRKEALAAVQSLVQQSVQQKQLADAAEAQAAQFTVTPEQLMALQSMYARDLSDIRKQWETQTGFSRAALNEALSGAGPAQAGAQRYAAEVQNQAMSDYLGALSAAVPYQQIAKSIEDEASFQSQYRQALQQQRLQAMLGNGPSAAPMDLGTALAGQAQGGGGVLGGLRSLAGV